MTQKRTTQILEGVTWKTIDNLSDVKVGQVFRMYESDGTRVVGDGASMWECTGYIVDAPVTTLIAKPIPQHEDSEDNPEQDDIGC